ncbi:MAG: histidine triad family protein [Actinomycetota bacterium]|nr:histidine triad family protein [Actinomycetota bacterium]
MADCIFCRIRDGDIPAHVVLDEEHALAFLDQRPVFPGHVLVIPRIHVETFMDLPHDLLEPFFDAAQRMSGAVQRALETDGIFNGINNVVSQSVPHLHMHVVPRRRKDGLRGFFWPRQRYESDEAMGAMAAAIRAALA